MPSAEYVHYGCGLTAPEEWTNFDASPTLRFERIPLLGRLYSKNGWRFPPNVRYGDIVKGLPIAAGGCKGIYCSHVLEHLAREDISTALDNTLSYLRSGGVFRAVVPSLEFYCETYLEAVRSGASDSNDKFMEAAYLGMRRRPKSLVGRAELLMSNSHHLWMWDHPSLQALFRDRGFSEVRKCEMGDSDDPMFALVEDPGRMVDRAVYVEGKKP